MRSSFRNLVKLSLPSNNSSSLGYSTFAGDSEGQHAIIFRATRDPRLLNGAATVLIPNVPILVFSQIGFAFPTPVDKLAGFLGNGSSHAFGYSAGSMEGAPSRWDVEEASQTIFRGRDFVENLTYTYRMTNASLCHNEVVTSDEPKMNQVKLVVAGDFGTVNSDEFRSFCARVADTHGIMPETIFYDPREGKLHNIAENGMVKTGSDGMNGVWEDLKIVSYNPAKRAASFADRVGQSDKSRGA